MASTDKNFLVPVGGAVVAGNNGDVIDTIGRAYPGRASATPCVDLLATLLGLGRNGWRSLLDEREAQLEGFRSSLEDVARKHGERLLETPHNRISFGVTLSALAAKARRVKDDDNAVRDRCTKFGSMLFTRCVSGTRVVARETEAKDIAGYSFIGWGASCDDYPVPYFTAACALGASEQELADLWGDWMGLRPGAQATRQGTEAKEIPRTACPPNCSGLTVAPRCVACWLRSCPSCGACTCTPPRGSCPSGSPGRPA